MKARFLLDEMISPRTAVEVGKRGYDARAVDGSELDGSDDRRVFRTAVEEKRILVTYNVAHFEPLVRDMLREYGAIPGIIFVNGTRLPTSDVAGLARMLASLARRIEEGKVNPAGGVFLGS